MLEFIYSILSFAAAVMGSITGMGSGVVMKPVLDIFGEYDVHTIGILSAFTVLGMSLVSVGKHVVWRTKLDGRIAIPLALGAVAGGFAGDSLLNLSMQSLYSDNVMKVVQNVLLAALLAVIFVYVLRRDKIRSLGISGLMPSCIAGVALGMVSSYLGIGGGPINVAVLMFVFSFDTKLAAVGSLVVIVFSQLSKLVSALMQGEFSHSDLHVLPFLIIAAIVGGFIGASLNRKMQEKTVAFLFNVMQVVVFLLCIANIVRYS